MSQLSKVATGILCTRPAVASPAALTSINEQIQAALAIFVTYCPVNLVGLVKIQLSVPVRDCTDFINNARFADIIIYRALKWFKAPKGNGMRPRM